MEVVIDARGTGVRENTLLMLTRLCTPTKVPRNVVRLETVYEQYRVHFKCCGVPMFNQNNTKLWRCSVCGTKHRSDVSGDIQTRVK